MLEFQDKLWSELLLLSWHVFAKKKISAENQHFFLKMTYPYAGHNLVAIGTVVHPDFLKYILGINKHPPKRRLRYWIELFFKKMSEKSI